MMQDEALKRSMFNKPMTKATRNSGIMAGFDENMEDMRPEEPEEQMSPMARTPQNPEILMNTLRGDMRSMDARVQELAQMVGDQAAQETPPEVLALLQAQLAAQQMPQSGIGGLPQSAGMPPAPGAGMPPEGMPAAPQGAGPMAPVGAPPFPQGASAPQQFSHGGAVEPPTPDGLPPMHAFLGSIVNPMARFAQMGADKAAMLGQEANIIGGRIMTQGFPQQFPGILENIRGPGGRFLAEQTLKYPTLTQHLGNVGSKLAEQYPRVAGAVNTVTQPVVAGAAALGASIPIINSMTPSAKRSPEEEAQFQELLGRIPTNSEFPTRPGGPVPPVNADEPPPVPSGAKKPAVPVSPAAITGEKTTDEFIKDQGRPAGANLTSIIPASSAKTDVESIREKYKEYGPLFKEILGDNNDDMRANAMLLLADAGFKYASARPTAGSTPVTIFSEAVADLPRGVASLVAQARDRKVKIDTAALSQAITDVSTEKKAMATLRSDIIKGDYSLLREQAKQGGGTLEDGGAGLVIAKTSKGGFVGVSIDPKNPTVQSAISSRWTLSDANPFVEFRGQAPTTVETDKQERTKLTGTLRSLDNSLSTLENLKGEFANAYGPGAWFNDKVNNLLVPVLPTALVRPDVNLVDTKTRINTGLNSIIKNIASANDSGRVAVQEQEWAKKTAADIENPTAFFQDKELAAKQFNSMETMLRNSRQQVLTQLGYEGSDYVMRTPNTGTKSDPFVVPADPTAQKQMFNFLGNSLGKIQQPNATVYLKWPNNPPQAFNPGQLKELVK
jgi:hypothetical protein